MCNKTGRRNEDKTIKLAIHFFSADNNSKTIKMKGRVFPIANKTRGIPGSKENGKMFNNFDNILPSIIEVLKKSQVDILENGKTINTDEMLIRLNKNET